jgi:hypothetical protein
LAARKGKWDRWHHGEPSARPREGSWSGCGTSSGSKSVSCSRPTCAAATSGAAGESGATGSRSVGARAGAAQRARAQSGDQGEGGRSSLGPLGGGRGRRRAHPHRGRSARAREDKSLEAGQRLRRRTEVRTGTGPDRPGSRRSLGKYDGSVRWRSAGKVGPQEQCSEDQGHDFTRHHPQARYRWSWRHLFLCRHWSTALFLLQQTTASANLRRDGHVRPRNTINSLAAAAPARFAPMVDAEGP